MAENFLDSQHNSDSRTTIRPHWETKKTAKLEMTETPLCREIRNDYHIFAMVERAEAEVRIHRLIATKHADELVARDRLADELNSHLRQPLCSRTPREKL